MLGFVIGELATHKSPRAPSSESSVVVLRGSALDLGFSFKMTFAPKRSRIFSDQLYLKTISRSQRRWYSCLIFVVVEMLKCLVPDILPFP